jgi:hypothetical protein
MTFDKRRDPKPDATRQLPADRGKTLRADRILVPLLVFLATFCLYLHTMAPTVYGLDSAELTTGAFTMGITHSPGAPLYMMLGKLFSLFPAGDVGWRVNLMSALMGALAAMFVHLAMRRLTGREWIGAATAWLLASSYYIWVWALVAELYAPHLCIAGALLWLVVKWRDTRRDRLLWIAGALAGLGTGNHTSLVLTAPGLAWLVVSTEPAILKRPWRVARPVLMAATAAAAVFLYLPLRHAANPAVDFVRDYFPDVDLFTWKGWFWMIRGGMFKPLFFSVPAAEVGRHFFRLAAQMAANFGLLALALSLLGLVTALCRKGDLKNVGISCLLLFVCHSGFYLTYGALDSEWMYSVSYLVIAVLFGLGLAYVAEHTASPAGIMALAGLLVLRLVLFNFEYVNLSGDTSARATGERILGVMGKNSLFVGMWEHSPILEYLQIVEKRRTDVTLVNGVFIGTAGSSQLAREAHRSGRRVYTTATNLFDAGFSITPVPAGLCYMVEPRATGSEPDPNRGSIPPGFPEKGDSPSVRLQE